MPRFIAIPVGQGDAFYFEREGWSVLIDGGRSRFAFDRVFRNKVQVDRVSVAVCTHNDADHAMGILGFIESGLRCDELWLPGRWLGALPSVLRPFVEVFVELADNVAQMEQSSEEGLATSGLTPIETYANQLREGSDNILGDEEGPPVGEDGWPESCAQMLEEADPWEDWPIHWLWPGFLYQAHLRADRTKLLWSAIEAANLIRNIALKSFHRGIPVRWFEFDATRPSGGIATLQPVNARAITRVRPMAAGQLLRWLALTVSNKESLVFWCPRMAEHPGVLFTADSDLAQVSLPHDLRGAIVTAPHHGAEANAKAYGAVASAAQQDFSSITWVRSDGRYRSRPGPTYLGLSSRRLCTLCRNSARMSSSQQAVHMFSRAAVWTRQRGTVTCSCQ